MYLRETLELLEKTRDKALLRQILEEHGTRGFSLGCKVLGITRGQGKRWLGIYDPTAEVKRTAVRACGLKTSSLWRC